MPKVIVERPRYGHSMRGPGKGYRRATRRIPLEEQPRRERLRQGGSRKHFSERLGPLVRFLENRVGRKWTEVEAEICVHLRRDSVIQDHVRDHLAQMVVTHVYLEKGRPYHAADDWIGHPVRARRAWFERFYVCPRSGLLKASPRLAKREWLARYQASNLPTRLIPHGHDEMWVLRRGVWLLATFQRIRVREQDYVSSPVFADKLLGEAIARDHAVRVYGRAIHVAAVRPATRKEVQRYCK